MCKRPLILFVTLLSLFSFFGQAGGAAANSVHRDHLGIITDYPTIQSAVNAAVDGDTISIDAGTFVEQVIIDKAITLQGAGNTTIIKSPANASLVASAQNNMKNMTRWAILDLRTATPGSGTITVRNLLIDGDYQGPTQAQNSPPTINFSGIAAYNSNALIDNVTIQKIAALWQGGPDLEGISRDECILAEGTPALGAAKVTVTIQNSTLSSFQKAGIDAWGANLHVIITNNHIIGSGVNGISAQNGIQIGSFNLDRPGTTGVISGNTIDHLGAAPTQVANGNIATGIYPVTAGAVEIYNNTVTLDPGSSANSLSGVGVGYGVYDVRSGAANVHDNTFNDMSIGILVTSASTTAVHIFTNNTLTTSGGDPVVFWYDPVGNGDTGGETIGNFKTGDAIQVVGENFSSGTVTAGNGTGLAANSVQIEVAGGNTTLHIDTTNAGAVTPITITLNGVYLPGNFTLSGEYIRFAKINQTITFTNPGNQDFGTTPTLTATASSGLTPTFTSATSAVCTITSGGALTFVTGGSCTINANQAGNSNYSAAPQVSQTFTVAKASATVTLGSLSQTYDGNAKSVTATTTPAGKTVTFAYDGSATAPTNAGSYAVVGTISDSSYQGSASGNLVINKGTATITLGSLSQTYDGNGKSATATTTPAGKTVTFTYDGSATVPTNAGSYAVVGTISDSNYQGTASGTLVIGKASQTITFGAVPTVVVNGTGVVSATAASGQSVGFSSTTPAVCTVTGATVTGVAAGTCTITADQAGDTNYSAAQANQTFSIGQGTQTIGAITFSPSTLTVGNATTVSATATSGLSVSFSSTSPAICTVSGTTVTGVSPGNCAITATQNGSASYSAATISQIITVTYSDTPPSLVISALSDGATTTDTTQNISGTVTDPAGIASVTVNDTIVHINPDGSFSYPVQLVAGTNTVTIVVTNNAGVTTTDTRTITLDATAPRLAVTYPPDNTVAMQQTVTVTGTIQSLLNGTAKMVGKAVGAVVDPTLVVTYSVNGSVPQTASLTDTTYSFTTNLGNGMNTIKVFASNAAGQKVETKRTVTYQPAFSLAITDPATDVRTALGSYTLTGNVTDNTTAVTVTITMDDQSYPSQQIPAGGGTFQQTVNFGNAKVYQVAIVGIDLNNNSLTVQRNIIQTVPKATDSTGATADFTIVDALRALQMSVGLVTPDTSQITRMDVAPMMNGISVGDGKIDIEDAVVILRMAVGLIQ